MADAPNRPSSGIVLHGVDFSGAEAGGAAKIRAVTRDLASPSAPVASMGRMDRRGLVRAVLASAADGRDHLWRIDAPMGLPLAVLAEVGVAADWRASAEWMHSLGSPRLWRSAMRDTTRREPRRTCDAALSTPMSPLNLRVFKQTWTFMCEVLLPLADAGIAVAPSIEGRAGAPVVCEGCPASVLHAKGMPRRGYKGGGDPPRRVRAEIVQSLRKEGMSVPDSLADEAVRDEEGDLLDAMLLATPPFQSVVPAEARVEGWVY